MAGPLTTQAQNEALVRYGPQRFALRELIAQAVQTRDMALHAATGAQTAIQHAISLARKETVHDYGAAGATTTGTRAMVDEALQGIGGAGQPFAAAIARERGTAQDRMTEGQTNSLQDLTNRRLEAASGAAYATSTAQRNYASDVGKIGRSYVELANEEGAFTQGRVAELKKEKAAQQFQRDLAEMQQSAADKRSRRTARTQTRGQNLSHQDRQAAIKQREEAAKNKPGSGRTVGGGVKIQSNSAHQGLIDSIESAKIDAKKQKDLGRGRQESVPLLTNGRNQQSITDPQSGQKLQVPGIKSHPSLAVQVAMDLTYDGKISRKTLAKLHSLGYSLKELGYPFMDRRGPGRGQGGPYGTGHIGG